MSLPRVVGHRLEAIQAMRPGLRAGLRVTVADVLDAEAEGRLKAGVVERLLAAAGLTRADVDAPVDLAPCPHCGPSAGALDDTLEVIGACVPGGAGVLRHICATVAELVEPVVGAAVPDDERVRFAILSARRFADGRLGAERLAEAEDAADAVWSEGNLPGTVQAAARVAAWAASEMEEPAESVSSAVHAAELAVGPGARAAVLAVLNHHGGRTCDCALAGAALRRALSVYAPWPTTE